MTSDDGGGYNKWVSLVRRIGRPLLRPSFKFLQHAQALRVPRLCVVDGCVAVGIRDVYIRAAREQLLEAALTVFAADVQLTDADGASGAIAVARTAQAHAAAQCEQLSALPALNFVGGGESYGAREARVLRRMLHFQLQSVRASVDDFGAEIESLEPEPEPEPEARKRR